MAASRDKEPTVPNLALPLERDRFLRELVGELAQTLEDVVGREEAAGFINIVGQHVAEWLDTPYREAYGVDALDAEQLANVLVDLKRRIQGGFTIEECTPERIVLVNSQCPFGANVKGRESLCMMTSTVFGTLAAENLGYAKVEVDRAIARGDTGCRVVLYLRETEATAARPGMEYFGS